MNHKLSSGHMGGLFFFIFNLFRGEGRWKESGTMFHELKFYPRKKHLWETHTGIQSHTFVMSSKTLFIYNILHHPQTITLATYYIWLHRVGTFFFGDLGLLLGACGPFTCPHEPGGVSNSILHCETNSGTLIDAHPLASRFLDKENYGLSSVTQRNRGDAPLIRANCNFKNALFNSAAGSVQLTPWNALSGQLQESPVASRGNSSAFRKIPNFWTFEHARFTSCSSLFIILTAERPK